MIIKKIFEKNVGGFVKFKKTTKKSCEMCYILKVDVLDIASKRMVQEDAQEVVQVGTFIKTNLCIKDDFCVYVYGSY